MLSIVELTLKWFYLTPHGYKHGYKT